MRTETHGFKDGKGQWNRDSGIGTATRTGWHRQTQRVRDSDRNSDRNLGTET